MIAGWLAGKLSGIIIFVMACLMPVCAVGWAWEGVALHGISIPFPIIGPFNLVDGALGQRDKAFAARDLAIRDRDIWHGNADRLGKGLDRCNISVKDVAAAGKALQDAAQKLVDQRLAEAADYRRRAAAVAAIKPTDAKCPTVDHIFNTGFGP